MFDTNVLMCRPTFYDVTYSINLWMNHGKPDHPLAMNQWIYLHHVIIRNGGFVHYIDPQPDLPDMVFTANGAMTYDGKVALAHFASEERRGEEEYYRQFFDGRKCLTFDGDEHFEGQGDAFIVNKTLFMGVNRTCKSVANKLMDFFGLKKLVLCELNNPLFYHLDTCFCPLSKGHVLFYPGAFGEDTLHAFETEAKLNWLAVTEEQAMTFACNAVNIKEHVIIPCEDEMPATIRSALTFGGYKVHKVCMSEFMKAGGAARCLTLEI